MAPWAAMKAHIAYSAQDYKTAAGATTVLALRRPQEGVTQYLYAKVLDAAGDWREAERAFLRCQQTGMWPGYCIAHRYFDLRRMGRKKAAKKLLAEADGGAPRPLASPAAEA